MDEQKEQGSFIEKVATSIGEQQTPPVSGSEMMKKSFEARYGEQKGEELYQQVESEKRMATTGETQQEVAQKDSPKKAA